MKGNQVHNHYGLTLAKCEEKNFKILEKNGTSSYWS